MSDTSQKAKRKSLVFGNIVKIPLGVNAKYGYVIVDKKYYFLGDYKWTLDHGYARGKINRKLVYMHQIVLKRKNEKEVIDHINRNPLDNRECNLRITTQSNNCFNSSIRKDNITGKKGVYFDKFRNTWNVSFGKKHFGRFKNFSDAVKKRISLEMEAMVYV